LNGSSFTLNAELIEQVERTPDTVITTVAGNNFVVKETVDEVIEKVIRYRHDILSKRQTALNDKDPSPRS
jgi:flagellar protein FlbD